MRTMLVASAVLLLVGSLLAGSSLAFDSDDCRPEGTLWRSASSAGGQRCWHVDGGGGIFNSGSASAVVARDIGRNGGRAAQLTINTDHGPAGVRLFRWRESQSNREAYYSAWFYFPRRYWAPTWWNVMQFKSRTSARNDPVWILNVTNRADTGNMYLSPYYWLSDGPGAGQDGPASFEQTELDLPIRRWVHVEIFLRQSSGAAHDGEIIVWQDGTEIFRMDDVRTRYPDGDQQWSVNSQSDHLTPSPATIYVDDAAISENRTYEAPKEHACRGSRTAGRAEGLSLPPEARSGRALFRALR